MERVRLERLWRRDFCVEVLASTSAGDSVQKVVPPSNPLADGIVSHFANDIQHVFIAQAYKMLSRNLKRALLDTRWPLPPTFLLPWSAGLTTVSHTTEPTPDLPPPTIRRHASASVQETQHPKPLTGPKTQSQPPPNAQTSPVALSPSVRELLPILKAQSQHYITIHIHGKPYLVTQGDTIRLPFLMHKVEPGDTLRLNRAVNIGSRDYTLKAAAAPPKLKSPTTDSRTVVDMTTGLLMRQGAVMPGPGSESPIAGESGVVMPPHFIPHIARGKFSYLDERLFVCRAVVMGVESEPLRIKEKTKRRQRKVKKVKSKHRFTILKIKEVRVRGLEELEGGETLS